MFPFLLKPGGHSISPRRLFRRGEKVGNVTDPPRVLPWPDEERIHHLHAARAGAAVPFQFHGLCAQRRSPREALNTSPSAKLLPKYGPRLRSHPGPQDGSTRTTRLRSPLLRADQGEQVRSLPPRIKPVQHSIV